MTGEDELKSKWEHPGWRIEQSFAPGVLIGNWAEEQYKVSFRNQNPSFWCAVISALDDLGPGDLGPSEVISPGDLGPSEVISPGDLGPCPVPDVSMPQPHKPHNHRCMCGAHHRRSRPVISPGHWQQTPVQYHEYSN